MNLLHPIPTILSALKTCGSGSGAGMRMSMSWFGFCSFTGACSQIAGSKEKVASVPVRGD